MIASALGKEEAVKLLIARGVNVKAKDKDGDTALAYAKAKNQTRIIALLEKASW